MAVQCKLPVRQDNLRRPGSSRHRWIVEGRHEGTTGIYSAAAVGSAVFGDEPDRPNHVASDQPIHIRLSASLVAVGHLLTLHHTGSARFWSAEWVERSAQHSRRRHWNGHAAD